MKKLFLLFAAGSIAMNVGAQESQQGLVRADKTPAPIPFTKKVTNVTPEHLGVARKATAGGDRWYNYANYIDTLCNYNAANTLGTPPNEFAVSAPYMWNDGTSKDDYTSGVQENDMVSLGTALDPTWAGFNGGYVYPPGEMVVTTSDAYIVDSIVVVGVYGFNPARAAAGVVDTLIVSVVGGTVGTGVLKADVYQDHGLTTTEYGSPNWYDVNYDSTGLNCAAHYYGATNHFTARIPMSVGDTLTTSSTVMQYDNVAGSGIGVGSYYKKIALSSLTPGADAGSGTVSVPAGSIAAITVSFKSGDATYADSDIIFTASDTYNFGMFRPLLSFLGTSATPAWPILNTGDNNVGLFKTLPDTARGWGHQYIPEWGWSNGSGTGGADLQNPYIWAHVTCATCTGVITDAYLASAIPTIVNSVNAYPNPSVGTLNITFDLSQSSNVSVTLSNMMGQVVATKGLNNTAKGSIVFNTANLPAGVYIYDLVANGNKTTGRVVVSH